MRTLYLILLIISAISFLAATYVSVPAGTTPRPAVRVNLLALGLLAWVLVPLIQTIDSLS